MARCPPGPDGEHWRLTPQSCWGIVTRYSKLTGIPATPHAFRHAMASAMLNNGAPISLIAVAQQVAGLVARERSRRLLEAALHHALQAHVLGGHHLHRQHRVGDPQWFCDVIVGSS
jgi:site-specific recombinase XerD